MFLLSAALIAALVSLLIYRDAFLRERRRADEASILANDLRDAASGRFLVVKRCAQCVNDDPAGRARIVVSS